MNNILGKLYDRVIPPLPAGDVDLLRKHKLFVNTCLFTTTFGFGYGLMSYVIRFPTGVWTMALSVVVFLLSILALRYINIKLLGFLVSLYIIWLNGILVYYSGGLFVSPVSPWIVTTAPVVLLLTDRKTAIAVLAVCLLYVAGYYVLIDRGYDFPFTYPESFHLPFLGLAYAGLVAIFFLLANTFESLKNQALNQLVKKQEELAAEQKRSEELLLNIFPKEVAAELKEKGKAEAHLHENVTVLLADVKNFSQVSEGMMPGDLVKLLHTYFKRIDAIVQKHGLEKIKTIGDAYLAASGVPSNNRATAKNVVEAAIEIHVENAAFRAEQERRDLPFFNFRIGIHTGTVVAGVVGEKKFAYDIWGDTVNVAARLEQSSEPGRINISRATYLLVQDEFICEPRGRIPIKNKEPIEMYWVHHPALKKADVRSVDI